MVETSEQTHVKTVDDNFSVESRNDGEIHDPANQCTGGSSSIHVSAAPRPTVTSSSDDPLLVQDSAKVKVDPNTKSTCTRLCNKENDDSMIECSKCKKWTHFPCTQLPIYQLYVLVNSARKYTCEKCANVPSEFKEKWTSTDVNKDT